MASYTVQIGGIRIEKIDGDQTLAFFDCDGMRYPNMSKDHVVALQKVIVGFIADVQALGEASAKAKR